MAEAQGVEADALGLVAATLSYLARSIVEHADDVTVETVDGERPTVRLRVNPADMGRVIGRHGHTARALRTVTKAAAAKAGIHVFVEIGD